MSWRRLLMQVHPSEPGLTYLSYYTSPDAETWHHFSDDVARLPERQELLDSQARPIYWMSSLNVDLSESMQFIGIVSSKYTRSELLLMGPDGPLSINNKVVRDGPVLPVVGTDGHEIGRAPICSWYVGPAAERVYGEPVRESRTR